MPPSFFQGYWCTDACAAHSCLRSCFHSNLHFLSPQLSANFLLTSIRKASSSFDQSTGIGLKWVTENMKITDLVSTRSFMDWIGIIQKALFINLYSATKVLCIFSKVGRYKWTQWWWRINDYILCLDLHFLRGPFLWATFCDLIFPVHDILLFF